MSNGLSLSLQYKWISKVDDDRKWHLVADSQKVRSSYILILCSPKHTDRMIQNKPFDHEKFKGDTGFEAAVFEKLLCAIYNRSYIIGSTKDLVILTEFADYYCVLPIVSRTLDGALLESPEFVHNIKKDPCTVFETAAKLRNKVLFREALIWVVGPWTSPNFKNLSDPRLRQVARCVYGEIATKVSNSSGRIMDGFIGSGNDIWSENFHNGIYAPQEPLTLGGSYLRGRPRLSFPCFFRNIDTCSGHLMPRNFFDDDLELSELLKNNLVLNRLELRSGDEDEEEADYFLCAEIEDEDLPWDITELDW